MPLRRSCPPIRNDPVALAAFNVFAEARCDYCHRPETKLPFYAKVPGTTQLIPRDISEGLRHFQFAPVLAALQTAGS